MNYIFGLYQFNNLLDQLETSIPDPDRALTMFKSFGWEERGALNLEVKLLEVQADKPMQSYEERCGCTCHDDETLKDKDSKLKI